MRTHLAEIRLTLLALTLWIRVVLRPNLRTYIEGSEVPDVRTEIAARVIFSTSAISVPSCAWKDSQKAAYVNVDRNTYCVDEDAKIGNRLLHRCL